VTVSLTRLSAEDEVDPRIEFTLAENASITIGRARTADVRIPALSVGHYVVRLTRRPEGVWVEDLASGGGSALEIAGESFDRPNMLLAAGAILRIGGVRFRVELP